jgi:hypothetical protein
VQGRQSWLLEYLDDDGHVGDLHQQLLVQVAAEAGRDAVPK